MDANRAIGDLTEISPQVRDVVIVDADGSIVGSNADAARAGRLATAAGRLLEAAAGSSPGAVSQLEAATTTGSVFVVRDGARTIAATTSAEPTVGLVFYDLKSCVRSLAVGGDDAAA